MTHLPQTTVSSHPFKQRLYMAKHATRPGTGTVRHGPMRPDSVGHGGPPCRAISGHCAYLQAQARLWLISRVVKCSRARQPAMDEVEDRRSKGHDAKSRRRGRGSRCCRAAAVGPPVSRRRRVGGVEVEGPTPLLQGHPPCQRRRSTCGGGGAAQPATRVGCGGRGAMGRRQQVGWVGGEWEGVLGFKGFILYQSSPWTFSRPC